MPVFVQNALLLPVPGMAPSCRPGVTTRPHRTHFRSFEFAGVGRVIKKAQSRTRLVVRSPRATLHTGIRSKFPPSARTCDGLTASSECHYEAETNTVSPIRVRRCRSWHERSIKQDIIDRQRSMAYPPCRYLVKIPSFCPYLGWPRRAFQVPPRGRNEPVFAHLSSPGSVVS